ncbi:MAG: helix-turn-helix domain-containing protein, partial [Butyricicoccus sp.]
LSYINEHYRSDLSIHTVAQANFITSNYLSRYFQRMLGTTFTDYLASVRLGSAYSELISTEKTITQIALDNGFRSTNAFIKYFKERYGDTPGKLRRDFGNQTAAPAHAGEDANIFQVLLRHVSREDGSDSPKTISRGIEVNVSHRGKLLNRQWKNLINIGYAKEGLQAAVQDQLRRIQQEIGFRYIRFHGLLDDDMLVYSEDAHGNPLLDFTLVDLLFDFVLSIGLKPYVEFGFVPSLLAQPQARVFRRGSYLCLPTDLDKWMFLVGGLVRHWEARYGKEELEHWYFTPMSISCILSEQPSAHQDYTNFFLLYDRVYRLLKEHSPNYPVCGPGVYSNSIEKPFLLEFLQSCAQHNCLPDQFTCLCFPYDPIDDKDYFHTISSFDLPYPDALSPDEQYVSHLIDTLHQKFSANGYDIPSIALIEWNSTMWQRDLCNDSCFKSAWLVKNITENMDRIWGMGYWTANEMLEETAPGSLDFHGGYGLFTCKGIPKSAYLALRLLNRLGDHLLYSGDSCIVTSRGNTIQVLFYHYCHYDELYRNNYLLDPNPTHCYDRFVEKGNLRILLDLYGLDAGTYQIRRFRLGREYGSTFDNWIAMGMPSHLNPEETAYLTASAQPDYHVSRVHTNQTLTFTSELAPHDIQLILIDPA